MNTVVPVSDGRTPPGAGPTQAIRRSLKGYNPGGFGPEALNGLVSRVHRKSNKAFQTPYWARDCLSVVRAPLLRRNRCASPKIRLLYNQRRRIILTVLPRKPQPGRGERLKSEVI